ncbi:ADP-forming succinate--CoA ligase subunit beta [Opitutus terrae]|uniref:Succinate--CoA ligase [ADP-forming] subunit beta n=1 Tax=Opitutus terrae (strain DSM 11246 / JCM 15787 / PB90-1) TaxID=452637 RepID=SUCC_OPITP|nr:ADP-forming succinate--CoA ligase subunit beta [Opitutus terrae]B1ZP17.1 RecName: Full=Succinate--CoA ligase [ADP-forming] subunit beta; AltName: Full=Succinyl-CoA synthetase subunit beta; Short=SCS-beta [Opitutus terrae PB90-1]ACB77506.1 succinyl-CoA synthetase, beta subunit [Opitutus terrae PB90-1]
MNIHEYQAKALFEKFGVLVPKGAPAKTPEEFVTALAQLPEGMIVVKSQIHAGGRGKGTFTDGFKGGVKVCKSKAEAREAAGKMLGNTLVTAQTGPAGRKVQTIYFNVGSQIKKEYYLAILLDRATSRPVIVASTEGGMEIEKVAHDTPDRIFKVHVDPAYGLADFQVRELVFKLGFTAAEGKNASKLIRALYRCFWENDASMVEVNPLITTPDGQVEALDAKVAFDDNALFRHPELVELRDLNEEDPKEIEASKHELNYIALDGNIACLVNGAGLAMSTMDIIKHFGGTPANFLDVGGGASREQVVAAFKIILGDKNVRGILVNIFGGIMDCNVIAQGIVDAVKEVGLELPLVVRLEGNNVAAGKATLATSGLKLVSGDSMADAAQKIVKLVA